MYREIFNAQLKYSADTIRFICEYNKKSLYNDILKKQK